MPLEGLPLGHRHPTFTFTCHCRRTTHHDPRLVPLLPLDQPPYPSVIVTVPSYNVVVVLLFPLTEWATSDDRGLTSFRLPTRPSFPSPVTPPSTTPSPLFVWFVGPTPQPRVLPTPPIIVSGTPHSLGLPSSSIGRRVSVFFFNV